MGGGPSTRCLGPVDAARVKWTSGLTRGPRQLDTWPRVSLTRAPRQLDAWPRVSLARAPCQLDTSPLLCPFVRHTVFARLTRGPRQRGPRVSLNRRLRQFGTAGL